MKISTKGRYGLKAMVDIGVYSVDNACVSIKNIAERQGISENYLEQLMAQLKKSGLVESVRGANGGYVLTRDITDISVGDILRALENDLQVTDCSNPNADSCKNSGCSKCVTKNVWEKLSRSMNTAADSITLAELVNNFKEINI